MSEKKRSRKTKDIWVDIKKNLTEEEINDLAQKIVTNKVFIDRQIRSMNERLVGRIFMPLTFLKHEQLRTLQKDPPEMIYSYYKDQVGNRYINGYPSFGSISFVWYQGDVEKVLNRAQEIHDFMKSNVEQKTDDVKEVDRILPAE